MTDTINTITNNTGQELKLWDGTRLLATVANNRSVHSLDIVITKVSIGNRFYVRGTGAFERDKSYLATLNGNTVNFAGGSVAHDLAAVNVTYVFKS